LLGSGAGVEVKTRLKKAAVQGICGTLESAQTSAKEALTLGVLACAQASAEEALGGGEVAPHGVQKVSVVPQRRKVQRIDRERLLPAAPLSATCGR
jgi:hypothetical protein